MADTLTLDNPLLRDIPLPIDRTIAPADFRLPADTRVISADNHWEIPEDIFYERFPAHLKERAPRIWYEGLIYIIGAKNAKGELDSPLRGGKIGQIVEAASALPGVHDLELRRRHLAAENISAEINFPSTILGMIHHPDVEVRELTLRIYNEYMVERQSTGPGIHYGVGVLSNWWDPSKVEGAVRQIVDLGLKTFMAPVSPGNGLDGQKILYAEPYMDRMWKAIEETGLPICFHIGENPFVAGRGGWGTASLVSNQPFNWPLGQLMFGGIFDRCPKLQVVFAEGQLAWIPGVIQEAEMILDDFRDLHDPLPKMRPSEYWRTHCYATFMNDLVGLKMIDYIGRDRVMWAQDYPHAEGTYGYSNASMKSVVDAVGEDDARMILGGTAAKVFGI